MKKQNKRIKVVLLSVIIGLLVLIPTVKLLDHYGSRDSKPQYPRYDMVSIESIIDVEKLYQGQLSSYDARQLFLQTGLGEEGVETLRSTCENSMELLRLLKVYQKQLFYGEETVTFVPMEKGDVLVSMSQRFCYYPHGHAAIVVDEEENLMLEARSYRAGSCIGSISKWSKLSSVVILRVKEEVAKELLDKGKEHPAIAAALYAEENLNGLPYSLIKEIRPFSETTPEYTQCAHLVWYAYYANGLDIDENRGLIIKPKDFLKSDVFEIVQVYGMDLEKLLKMRNE